MISVDCITRYEHEGRQLGLIRNFCRYQRPKFPKSVHFIPDDLRSYAGSRGPPTETERHDEGPVPRNEEKYALVEDVGGRRKERKKDAADAAPDDLEKQLFRRGKEILGDNSGGLIKNLVKAKGSIAMARSALEVASGRADPREYIGACLRQDEARIKGDAW